MVFAIFKRTDLTFESLRNTKNGNSNGNGSGKMDWKMLYFVLQSVFLMGVLEMLMMWGTRYVPAAYAQLLGQPIPLVSALINKVWSHKPLPPLFYPATILMIVGAVLAISGGGKDVSKQTAEESKLNYFMGIAMISLATTSIVRAIMFQSMAVLRNVSVVAMALYGELSLTILSGIMAVIQREEWKPLDAKAYITVPLMTIAVLAANILQLNSLRQYGSPFVSSLLAVRIISVIILAWILMNEELKSVYQWIGILVKGSTSTMYTIYTNRQAKKSYAMLPLPTASAAASMASLPVDDTNNIDINSAGDIHIQSMNHSSSSTATEAEAATKVAVGVVIIDSSHDNNNNNDDDGNDSNEDDKYDDFGRRRLIILHNHDNDASSGMIEMESITSNLNATADIQSLK